MKWRCDAISACSAPISSLVASTDWFQMARHNDELQRYKQTDADAPSVYVFKLT